MNKEKDMVKKDVHYLEVIPAADIIDEEKDAILILEVPGANSKSVSVEVKNQVLSVEAKSTLTHGGAPLLYKRAFQLSDAVDVENISAKTQDGVLTLTLPKSERAKVHRIAVE
ncbi:MAG: Hsp20/alpha crystallin family protein [Lentisphaeria bacterium]|mgnify:CR=1 FL=1|nr:Hsp20/alpha crystallin family protein [Lentisphaeria bacterium]